MANSRRIVQSVSLHTATKAELLAQLAKIKAEENAPPAAVENPDWTEVIRQAKEYAENHAKHKTDSDDEHYMFEEVMKAVFGANYFDWHNSVEHDDDEDEVDTDWR